MIGRYAARVNGITDFFLTKLDVLSGLETVPICVAYEVDGRRVDEMPMTQSDVHHAVPVYEELPGCSRSVAVRSFDGCRPRPRLRGAIAELTGAPGACDRVGPGATNDSREVWTRLRGRGEEHHTGTRPADTPRAGRPGDGRQPGHPRRAGGRRAQRAHLTRPHADP